MDTRTETIAASENYRGTLIEIIEGCFTYDGADAGKTRTYRLLQLDGSQFRCPVGTTEQIIAKARTIVDRRASDDEIRTAVTALIANVHPTQLRESTPADLTVGAEAFVYAMGYWRRGIVTKVAKTRYTVTYTTASSQGRIFHKAANLDGIRVAP